LKDKRRIFPCAAWLRGEYGIKDLYVGVPVVIGEKGVEKIIEVSLNKEERVMFDHSVAAVRELVDAVQNLDKKASSA
jgi:malate dehydrogenase